MTPVIKKEEMQIYINQLDFVAEYITHLQVFYTGKRYTYPPVSSKYKHFHEKNSKHA